jgi:hypothetical protein
VAAGLRRAELDYAGQEFDFSLLKLEKDPFFLGKNLEKKLKFFSS